MFWLWRDRRSHFPITLIWWLYSFQYGNSTLFPSFFCKNLSHICLWVSFPSPQCAGQGIWMWYQYITNPTSPLHNLPNSPPPPPHCLSVHHGEIFLAAPSSTLPVLFPHLFFPPVLQTSVACLPCNSSECDFAPNPFPLLLRHSRIALQVQHGSKSQFWLKCFLGGMLMWETSFCFSLPPTKDHAWTKCFPCGLAKWNQLGLGQFYTTPAAR